MDLKMNNKGKGMTHIGAEMSLNGEMVIKGPAVIAGKTNGIIRSTDQIKVEFGGKVEGEVFCQEIIVSGSFKGQLHCNKLIIVSTGVVEGDVSSHQMEIYDGGQFIGMRTKGPEDGILPQAEVTTESTTSQQQNKPAKPTGAKKDTSSITADKSSTAQSSSTSVSSSNGKSKMPLVIGTLASLVVLGLVYVKFDLGASNQAAPKQEPALFSSSDADGNNLPLLDINQESSFVEQHEELVSAGQADTEVAMEDLQAMEQTSEELAQNQNVQQTNASQTQQPAASDNVEGSGFNIPEDTTAVDEAEVTNADAENR